VNEQQDTHQVPTPSLWPIGFAIGVACILVGLVVSVPARWRRQVAVGWGQIDPTSSLRIETCPPLSVPQGWNPYSGGFYLRSRARCVPLTFTVAGRSATVRFGVGKRCGSA